MGMPRMTKRFERVVVYVENVGNWPLTLDYWSDFRTNESNYSSVSITLNQINDPSVSMWDMGYWDVATWDGYTPSVKPIVFNLSNNNSEGEVIKLRFRNQGSEQPVTIYGFGIIFSTVAMR
jgi:hypothetical protein